MRYRRFLVLHNERGKPIAATEIDVSQGADAYWQARSVLFDQWLAAAGWIVIEKVEEVGGGKR